MKQSSSPLFTAFAVGAVAMGLLGCLSANTGTESHDRRQGQIRLVSMDGLGKAGAVASGSHVFTLDTARASFQQYFILQNTGETPVTDIELTTDNPAFTFSPSRIAVLPPSANASIIQVIKLNVVHGTRLDAIGSADYLAPGHVTVNVLLSGETIDDGDTVESVAEATLSTYALLAQFTLETDVDTFQLTDLMHGTTFDNRYGVGGIPHYYVPMDSASTLGDGITMRNTGNTTLYIENVNPHTHDSLPPVVLAPDSSWSFNSALLEVDSKGTVFAPADVPLNVSGKVLFIAYPDF